MKTDSRDLDWNVVAMRSSLSQTRDALLKLAEFVREMDSEVNAFVDSQMRRDADREAAIVALNKKLALQEGEMSGLLHKSADDWNDLVSELARLKNSSADDGQLEERLQEIADKYVKARTQSYGKDVAELKQTVQELTAQGRQDRDTISTMLQNQKLLIRCVVRLSGDSEASDQRLPNCDGFEPLAALAAKLSSSESTEKRL